MSFRQQSQTSSRQQQSQQSQREESFQGQNSQVQNNNYYQGESPAVTKKQQLIELLKQKVENAEDMIIDAQQQVMDERKYRYDLERELSQSNAQLEQALLEEEQLLNQKVKEYLQQTRTLAKTRQSSSQDQANELKRQIQEYTYMADELLQKLEFDSYQRFQETKEIQKSINLYNILINSQDVDYRSLQSQINTLKEAWGQGQVELADVQKELQEANEAIKFLEMAREKLNLIKENKKVSKQAATGMQMEVFHQSQPAEEEDFWGETGNTNSGKVDNRWQF